VTGLWNDRSPDGLSPPLSYIAAAAPSTPTEFVLLGPCGRVIGRLRFRTCPTCRTPESLSLVVWPTVMAECLPGTARLVA
jgi:hypothetical protein